MYLYFNNSKSYLRVFFRYLFLLFIYFLFTKYPTFNYYTLNLIPEINFRVLIEQINEIIYMPFIIKILANLLTISFANDLLINACNFSIYKNNTIINKEVNPSYIITYFEVCLSRLELSNPFLYANKTRELRE